MKITYDVYYNGIWVDEIEVTGEDEHQIYMDALRETGELLEIKEANRDE